MRARRLISSFAVTILTAFVSILLRRHYILLRADWTRYDSEITSELSRVGRSGVPTYVIFSGQSERATHVLPELLTRGVVLDAIRQAGTQQGFSIKHAVPGFRSKFRALVLR